MLASNKVITVIEMYPSNFLPSSFVSYLSGFDLSINQVCLALWFAVAVRLWAAAAATWCPRLQALSLFLMNNRLFLGGVGIVAILFAFITIYKITKI